MGLRARSLTPKRSMKAAMILEIYIGHAAVSALQE
jgi:hypothetical protein